MSFRSDMAALGAVISFSRQARRQLAAEITAQFAAFRATGLALDHCNAHKHFHLHPVVGGLMAAIGAGFGLRATRIPLEPAHVLRTIEPETPSAPAALTTPFALLLRRRASAAGLLAPDRVFGLRWSGQMTRAAPVEHHPQPAGRTQRNLSASGHRPLPRGRASLSAIAEEFDALMAPGIVAACRDASLELGGFGDFLGPQPTARPGALQAAMPARSSMR